MAAREISKEEKISNVETYKKHLENKYGQITIESIKKDQASLDKAGKRMSGHDIIIAPSILEDMANSPEKAAYYEQKIDDFFHAAPKLKAYFAAQGLNYEPCGVVIHEDRSVTYISGAGDSAERIAEVNAINHARDKKRAAQRKQYRAYALETGTQEQSFFNISDLLKTRLAASPSFLLAGKKYILS